MIRMSKEDEYRDYAFTTIELAKRQPSGADKNRLLVLAEAWVDLAERAAKRAKAALRGVTSKGAEQEANPPQG
jgi:hypothetical protein